MSTHQERVAVLMGGWTPEASVSRVSASFCGQAARNAGWDAVEIELDPVSYTHLTLPTILLV